MRELGEQEIRDSFINCSKGEAKRINLPRDLGERPWEELDFLGWTDPGAPDRSYLVTERDGKLVGVTLRLSANRGYRPNLCSLCYTGHTRGGVCLMAARKAGKAGKEGNSYGIYICSDLACSLYIRGKKVPPVGGARYEESLTTEEQVERARTKLYAFLDELTKQSVPTT
ncbi:FBP domain-containing protein [Streptomyces sp. UNOC14_S4]|uniref:FBP domain-containing protein n=1 Tax=Streptomyces sp. UNOC14_S4 TaxID=2872340 RepID=UPI001E4B85CD|nr:FBP domain-containing protein [Streptomyces sp. UNOC14_S4]MCC3767907.1 FBP domain-containing protein [Streptomyces sp. UNOC14_S4]